MSKPVISLERLNNLILLVAVGSILVWGYLRFIAKAPDASDFWLGVAGGAALGWVIVKVFFKKKIIKQK
ncbi:MAG: hypothetical protein AAFO07_21200 [Bacteroidota bacterium]